MNNPNNRAGLRIEVKLIPEARMALISLSSDNLPKAISVAISTAIGTARAIIQARFRNRYSSIVKIFNPFPKKRSIALRKKLIKSINTMTIREYIKGSMSSFIIYCDTRRMEKITDEKANMK